MNMPTPHLSRKIEAAQQLHRQHSRYRQLLWAHCDPQIVVKIIQAYDDQFYQVIIDLQPDSLYLDEDDDIPW